jgi:hypothetical protein
MRTAGRFGALLGLVAVSVGCRSDRAAKPETAELAAAGPDVNRCRAALENEAMRAELLARFDALQKRCASPTLTPEEMRDCRRELAELDAQKALLGDDQEQQVVELTRKVPRVFARRMLDDAKATAAANPDLPRAAIRKAAIAEDTLGDSLRKWCRRKPAADPDAAAEIAFYEPLYKEAIELSDSLVQAAFGPQIGATTTTGLPWKDELSSDLVKNWNATNTKGFTWRIEDGALEIVGPDPDERVQALLAIGDREQWRHFLLEFEVTIEQGSCDLYFRLGKSPNPNTPSYRLATTGDGCALAPGTSTRMRVALLGSRMTVSLLGDDGGVIEDDLLPWTKTRKGAIGLVIPPGAKLRFTEFKVCAFE